jgi:hypothetical protein
MKKHGFRSSAIVGMACALVAGAAVGQGDAGERAAQLKTYNFGELGMDRYEIVGRPWVDSWRAAFWMPTFPTQEQALAALRTEAASRGADGLVNVSCRDQGPWAMWSTTEPAFLCFGLAIRVRPSSG